MSWLRTSGALTYRVRNNVALHRHSMSYAMSLHTERGNKLAPTLVQILLSYPPWDILCAPLVSGIRRPPRLAILPVIRVPSRLMPVYDG